MCRALVLAPTGYQRKVRADEKGEETLTLVICRLESILVVGDYQTNFLVQGLSIDYITLF